MSHALKVPVRSLVKRIFFPLRFNVFLSVGYIEEDYYYEYAYYGDLNITTKGLMGTVSWDSNFLMGTLYRIPKGAFFYNRFRSTYWYYVGMSRFSGLIFLDINSLSSGWNYMGWAFLVGIDKEL